MGKQFAMKQVHCDLTLMHLPCKLCNQTIESFHTLQVNGKTISWRHLEELYQAKVALSNRSGGLYLLQKLKLEHIQLSSFSRMRVDLAAQVSNIQELDLDKLDYNYSINFA